MARRLCARAPLIATFFIREGKHVSFRDAGRAKFLIDAFHLIELEFLPARPDRNVVDSDTSAIRRWNSFLKPAMERVLVDTENFADLAERIALLQMPRCGHLRNQGHELVIGDHADIDDEMNTVDGWTAVMVRPSLQRTSFNTFGKHIFLCNLEVSKVGSARESIDFPHIRQRLEIVFTVLC